MMSILQIFFQGASQKMNDWIRCIIPFSYNLSWSLIARTSFRIIYLPCFIHLSEYRQYQIRFSIQIDTVHPKFKNYHLLILLHFLNKAVLHFHCCYRFYLMWHYKYEEPNQTTATSNSCWTSRFNCGYFWRGLPLVDLILNLRFKLDSSEIFKVKNS